MKDDFWTGKLDWTGIKSFDGFGDGMASGSVGSEIDTGNGRGFGNGKGDIIGFSNF